MVDYFACYLAGYVETFFGWTAEADAIYVYDETKCIMRGVAQVAAKLHTPGLNEEHVAVARTLVSQCVTAAREAYASNSRD